MDNFLNDKLQISKDPLLKIDSEKMTIIPTIDISKGRAVLVCQGKVIVDNGDPLEKAEFLSINSDFQIVDLDRAMEIGDNSVIMKKICQKYPCYVAGGIRNLEIASEFLNNNAKRVVIGTALNKELFKKIPKNRLIVAFDIDENFNLYKRGRKELTNENIFEKIEEFADYLSFITVTFHYTEGKGQGTDFEKINQIKAFIRTKEYKIRLAVAGGINSVTQIKELVQVGIIPQFGHGLWKNIFTLGHIYSAIMNYDKMEEYYNFTKNSKPILFPCVIFSTDGRLLGLTYTDSTGIKESIDERKCIFYSRERQARWMKGETSGNIHKILNVGVNCDRTALVYVVDGSIFCHMGKKSCFNFRDPSFGSILSLENYIKNSLISKNENSYTRKILANKNVQICKMFEETLEVSTSTNRENLIHELADLIYFTITYSISNGIEIKEIYNEFSKRHFKISKEKFEMNPLPNNIKLGICLNKHSEKTIFKFIDEIGINIILPKEGSRSLKYEGNFKYFPEIKILPFIIKPKDVAIFMQNNLMDAVLCYQDVLDNYPVNYEVIQFKENGVENTNRSRICVLSKNGNFDISEYENNPTKKLRVLSEYINLTTKWLEKRNILAKVIPITGSAEGFLHHNLCDLVVCVVDTGRTVVENGLKIIDTIYESKMGLFASNDISEFITRLLKPNFDE